MRQLYIALWCAILISIASIHTQAQSITNYTFSATSGTFTEITGTELPLNTTSTDANVTMEAPIGFDFWYMGVRYTSFFVASDGVVGLLNPSTAWSSTSFGANNLPTGSSRPMFAPFWDDNDLAVAYASKGHGAIQYAVSGSVGSRVLTIQWLNMEANFGANVPVLSMQVKISESNGSVQFVYRPEGNSPSSATASIGIQGPTSGQYLSLNNTSASPTASSSTETATISTVPANGQQYTFTPGSTPTAPSAINFTAVTINGMTVNWTDNSTNENGFALYASRDGGTTYQFMGTAIANATAFSISGLEAGSYMWRVHAFNETIGTAATGTQSTSSGLLSGTYTIGPSGNYASLTAALAALGTNGMSGSVVLELQSSYTSSGETYPLTFNRTVGSSRTATITVRPATGATGLAISGGSTTALIDLAGALGVIIDGRPGGTGTTSELTLENTTSGPAVRFISDAQYDTVRYCTIRSANITSTSGTIFFSTPLTGSTGTGNNFNVIANNNIREATGGTTPANGIYNNQSGTNRQTWNRNNAIIDNNIFNFFHATATPTGGIILQNGYTDWTITGNSIYQTATRVPTGTSQTYYGIGALASATNGGATRMIISNNFVGGSAPNCGNTAYTMNTGASTTITYNYIGIQHAHGTVPASSIMNNTIANFNLTTSSTLATTTGGFAGIVAGYNQTSTFSVQDTISGNTIGSGTGAGNISVTFNNTSTTVPYVIGIQTGGSSEGSRFVVTNNTIGSITASHTLSTVAAGFIGINVVSIAANNTISNNTIGSTSTANSINMTTASTTTGTCSVDGIRNGNTNARYIQTISNNTIANLNNNSISTTSSGSMVRGIVATSGICSITDNTVRNLTTSSLNPAFSVSASAIHGIIQSASTAPADFSPSGRGQVNARNTVHSLALTNSSAITTQYPTIFGIVHTGSIPTALYTAASVSNVIERNNVHSFGTNSSMSTTFSTNSQGMTGIYSNGGPGIIQNNMVRLGIDASGASLVHNYQLTGIWRASTSTPNYYKIIHNSIYVGGTQSVATTVPISMALWKQTNPTPSPTLGSGGQRDTVMNNIIVNERQSNGFHGAFILGDTTGTLANNNLFSPGTTSATTWTAGYGASTITFYRGMRYWQGVVFPSDNQTVAGNPNYINPTGSASAVDLHINTSGTTPIEGNGLAGTATATQDFDAQTRSSLTPVDIGADAGSFTSAGDIVPPAISFAPLTAGPTGTASRTLSSVTITDASGINTTSGTRPRVYYKKKVEGNVFSSANNNSEDGWKWVEASGTTSPFSFSIDYSKLTSAPAVNDTIQYFVVAQDLASTPNVASATAAFATDPTSVNLASGQFPIVLGPPSSVREYRISAALSGTFTVGPSGATFPSLTNTAGAFDSLNKVLVTGNIVLEITGNLVSETGTVALNQMVYDQAGLPFTITIRPAAATNSTISGTSSTGLIQLNGADRVIIDGRRSGETTGRNLTLVNTSTAHGSSVVKIMSTGAGLGAVADTVRFCNIRAGASGTLSASTYGIQITGSGTFTNPGSTTSTTGTGGADNRLLSITNNIIDRATWGIYARGVSTGVLDTLQVANNILGSPRDSITNFLGSVGIEVFFANGVSLVGNTIQNIITANINPKGINIGTNVQNSVINGNTIRNLRFTSTGGYGGKGIDVYTATTSSNLTIANNMVTTMSGDGWNATTTDAIVGIRIGNTLSTVNGNIRVINNTVVLRDTLSPTTSTGRLSPALYFGASSTNMDVRNNILVSSLVNNTTTTQSTFALYSDAPASAFTTINNNNYFVNAGSQGILAYFGGANRTTLSALQAATGQDTNSVSSQPVFISDSTDLHLSTVQAALKGTNATSSIASNDFDNVARTLYLMGADDVKANFVFGTQPANVTICQDSVYTNSVAVTASSFDDGITRPTPSLTYQWLRNNTDISGATTASLSTTALLAHNGSTLRARVVAGGLDTALSNTATLTVNPTSSITTQPAATTTRCLGASYTISIAGSATGTPTYQWQKSTNSGSSWTNITGATNATYTIAAVASGDYASYRALFGGTCSQVASTTAELTQIAVTAITEQPTTPVNLCLGSNISLTGLVATGDNLTYQWSQSTNGGSTWSPLSGATSSTYTKVGSVAADSGLYRVVVTGTCGAVTSSNVALAVQTPVSITTQPTWTSPQCIGQSATVSIVAAGTSPTYQWSKDGTPITGATNASYTISALVTGDAGSYTCIVGTSSTCANSVTSSGATLTPVPNVQIVNNPTALTQCAGTSASFTFTTNGQTITSTQWQRSTDGGGSWNNIAGATNSTYTINPIAATDQAQYRIQLVGSCGVAQVNSTGAQLTVQTPFTITGQPSFSSSPQALGATVTLTATTTGTATYQWQKSQTRNGTYLPISGATNATYSFVVTAISDSGDYQVVVSGPCNGSSTNSSIVPIYTCQPPTITLQPIAPSAVCPGAGTALTLSTNGTVIPGLSVGYQWQQDRTRSNTWTDIPGATNATYTKSNLTMNDSGNYRCNVYSTCAPQVPVYTNVVNQVIFVPVTITGAALVSVTQCEGTNVSFTTSAVGTNQSYQWLFNGNPITGNTTATTPTLLLNLIQPAQSGQYSCRVSGTCTPLGVTTNSAALTVNTNIRIVTQPSTQYVCQDSSLRVSVGITGSNPVYQWRFNGTPITGNATATSAMLVIPNATPAVNGSYDVVITGACSNVTSSATVVTMENRTAITLQPQNQSLCIGENASAFIQATGTIYGYQWYKDGNIIPGATRASLTVPNVTINSSGLYTCAVTGATSCGTGVVISNPAVFFVSQPTRFTVEPVDQAVSIGSTIIAQAEGIGLGVSTTNQLQYAWFRNGNRIFDDARISGSNSTLLTIRNITPGDVGGGYSVEVTGRCGTAVSRQFSLFVPEVNITQQPLAQTQVCIGSPAALNVQATSSTPNGVLTYQWLKNGQPIVGATNTTYSIATPTTSDSGNYTVQVTVQPGGVRTVSNIARINVNSQPTVTTQPSNAAVCVGDVLTLTAAANGGSLGYQWTLNGTPITGATSATYSTSATAAMTGNYLLVATNTCGTVSTNAATVTVNTPPTISTQPVAVTNTSVLFSFTLSVTTTSTLPMTYQWFKDGTAITGATNDTYSRTNLQSSDEGVYTVRVTNSCGEVTSQQSRVNISTTSVDNGVGAVTGGYTLSSSEPNPVLDLGTIRFTVPTTSIVHLGIYDVTGRQVIELVNGTVGEGTHSAVFNPTSANLSSGMYQVVLTTGNITLSRRVVVIR